MSIRNTISPTFTEEIRETVTGTLPTEDNSSISSSFQNGEAWLDFKNMLQHSISGGSTFNNNGVGGIITPPKILLGTLSDPFSSPQQAQNSGYPAGSYYFISGAMSSALLLEYQPNYYENKPFCCVFRSPYAATATTNRINLNIPMAGLLVQRDTLDLRGAVYWSTPITYTTVGGAGNNTADSGTGYAGSNARRVILGNGGGHGIYNTGQSSCNWPSAAGAIGAGYDGVNCGSFPNGLFWGTGNGGTAVYDNRSGTWSHWITWN